MHSHKPWGFLPTHATAQLAVEVARSSLRLRAGQSIAAKWVVWAVCAVTVFALNKALPLTLLATWAVPIMVMAEVNWRVCKRVMGGLDDANSTGLRQREIWLWWMSAINQTLLASTVWWFGADGDMAVAAIGTALQLVYLGSAMVNATTHPTTFVFGAWINLLSATVYWATHGSISVPLALSLVGAGLMVTQLSLHMSASFADSLRMRFENQALLRQLEAEKRVAEEATRFKSEFLSNISHEIRTPVSAIMGMSYLAGKSAQSPKQRDYLQVIQQCSQHLHGLVNQVLDFSKVEASMLKLEKAEFSLKAVLENVQSINADAATAKGLALGMEVGVSTPERLMGDSLRLTEILVNFVSNAIKFTHTGHVQLHIEARPAPEGRACLKFSVHDTGIGLTPGQIGTLFQSFTQADTSTTRHYGGTGLGLAISKKLAELMGGDVGVSSDLGVGSVFWCTACFDLPDVAGKAADPEGAGQHDTPWTHQLPAAIGDQNAGALPSLPDDGGPQAMQCQRVAWLAANDDPGALALFNAEAEALQARLGGAFMRVAQALHRYQLPLAHQLLSNAGYSGCAPVGESLAPQSHAARPCVLVVDDTPVNLTLMVDLLSAEYRVRVAADGQRALAIATAPNPPDLVLLDVMMPGQDGYEIIGLLKANPATADIPVIFLTAKSQMEDEEKGLQLGAVDFIAKPISPPIVLTRVRTQLALKLARDFLVDKARYLETEVQRRTAEVKDIQEVTIVTMASVCDRRDYESGQQFIRTQHYVRLLARALQQHPRFADYLSDAQIELLFKSAPLHDIGKVGIPDRILLKPGRHDADEMAIMKTHTTIGRDTIEAAERRLGHEVPFLVCAKQIAHSHQEKWDGSGYPQALKGDDIPIAARLMAVADVYDALISRRVYKPPFPHAQAVDMIRAEQGKHFDPDVVEAFCQIHGAFRTVALAHADADTGAEADTSAMAPTHAAPPVPT